MSCRSRELLLGMVSHTEHPAWLSLHRPGETALLLSEEHPQPRQALFFGCLMHSGCFARPQPPRCVGVLDGSKKQPCSPRCPHLGVLSPAWPGRARGWVRLVLLLALCCPRSPGSGSCWLLGHSLGMTAWAAAGGTPGLALALLLRGAGIPRDPGIPAPSLQELM